MDYIFDYACFFMWPYSVYVHVQYHSLLVFRYLHFFQSIWIFAKTITFSWKVKRYTMTGACSELLKWVITCENEYGIFWRVSCYNFSRICLFPKLHFPLRIFFKTIILVSSLIDMHMWECWLSIHDCFPIKSSTIFSK